MTIRAFLRELVSDVYEADLEREIRENLVRIEHTWRCPPRVDALRVSQTLTTPPSERQERNSMRGIILLMVALGISAQAFAQDTITKYTIGAWPPGTAVTAATQTAPLVSLDVLVPSAGLLCGQAQPAVWPLATTDFDLSQPIPNAILWWGEAGFPGKPLPGTVCSYPVTVWANSIRTLPLLQAPGAYVWGIRATSNTNGIGPWEGGLPNFIRPVLATAPGAPRFPRIVKQ